MEMLKVRVRQLWQLLRNLHSKCSICSNISFISSSKNKSRKKEQRLNQHSLCVSKKAFVP